MSRKTRIAMLALAVSVVGMSIGAVQASAITIPYTFSNWAVWGSLTPKKLNEPVVLPKGSTFNGTSVLTSTAIRPDHGAGLAGHCSLPGSDPAK